MPKISERHSQKPFPFDDPDVYPGYVARYESVENWRAAAVARFGKDPMKWRFICPSCHHIASVRDWRDAGAPEGAVAYSCVGRWTSASDDNTFRRKGGPCLYAGGGLFGLNPVRIEMPGGGLREVFEFAPMEGSDATGKGDGGQGEVQGAGQAEH